MNKKDIYKLWAPYNNKWSGWVRPVPFINIDKPKEINTFVDYNLPNVDYLNLIDNKTAVIIDEEGIESIKEGIASSLKGYRPIPIFNGTLPNRGAECVVNSAVLENMLVWGASILNNVKISDDALPIFLTDSNRLTRHRIDRSIFDNSWDVYPQDLPTHDFFIKNGIDKILIKGPKLNPDLARILYKHQKNGIDIYYTDGFNEPKLIKLKKVEEEL